MWFDIEKDKYSLTVKKRVPTRIYDFVFRFFYAFLLGALLGGVYYGIDFVGRESAGIEVGEGYWLSVLIIISFFSIAWANLSILRSSYLVFDGRSKEIKIFQKWIFGTATSQEIPFQHIRALEVCPGFTPSLQITFKDGGTYNLLNHFSPSALNSILEELESFSLPFSLKTS